MNNKRRASRSAWTAHRLRSLALVCAALVTVVACGGDDDAPPSPVGGFGAMDGGGGVGADGGGGVGADDGGGGSAGDAGSAGTMDASFDGGDASDLDGGALDAGPDANVVGPNGWLCRGSLWSDGVCDCGCGLLDVDCRAGACAEPGCRASACEACFAVDGTLVECAESVWLCDPSELNDANDFCDCGCGAPDPDCRGQGCTGASCRAQRCDRCHDEAQSVIGCQVPIEWQCDRGAFSDGTQCDCGCGAPDPDCGSGGCSDGFCSEAACDVCRNSGGGVIPCGLPAGWLCSPLDFDSGDGCDCGCGAPDPDCGSGGCEGNACNETACESCHADSLQIVCDVPSAWTCHPAFYDSDDICNCGCGVADPDCAGDGCTNEGCTASGCELCFGGTQGFVECANWTCDDASFGQGDGCDCGCGSADPDCLVLPSCTGADCEVDTCETCGTASSRRDCGGWACGLERYRDGHCDCGCGAADPDCDGAGCAGPGCTATACEVCRDSQGRVTACAGTGVCAVERLGTNDGCDCGCGAVDADCVGLSACTQPGCTASECARCHDPRGRVIQCP